MSSINQVTEYMSLCIGTLFCYVALFSIFVELWHHLNYYNFNSILLSDCVNPPSLFFNIYFYLFIICLAALGLICSMWDLSFLTRDWTQAPYIGSSASWPQDHQGSLPPNLFFRNTLSIIWPFATCHLELLCQFSLSLSHTHIFWIFLENALTIQSIQRELPFPIILSLSINSETWLFSSYIYYLVVIYR